MPTKRSEPAATIPKNYEGVVNLITREYANLSTGFQQIARFLTQNPNVVALESINAVAAKCRMHPSSLVRFAQSLGYSGFKQLQSVFQTRLATAAPGFRERISALESELSRNKDHGSLGYCGIWSCATWRHFKIFSKSYRKKPLPTPPNCLCKLKRFTLPDNFDPNLSRHCSGIF